MNERRLASQRLVGRSGSRVSENEQYERDELKRESGQFVHAKELCVQTD